MADQIQVLNLIKIIKKHKGMHKLTEPIYYLKQTYLETTLISITFIHKVYHTQSDWEYF